MSFFSKEKKEEFSFWHNNVPQLTIINPEDFPIRSILDSLGITRSSLSPGFGNCNAEEAKGRSEVMEFIYNNPKIAEILKRLKDVLYDGMPSNETSFCTFYDPAQKHNPLWEGVNELLSFLSRFSEDQLPSRMKTFREKIKATLQLEDEEKLMAKIIGELLASTAVFEGVANISAVISHENPGIECPDGLNVRTDSSVTFEEFHGHRTFSFALSEARQKNIPEWIKGKYNPLRWMFGWLITTTISIYNQFLKSKASKAMVFSTSNTVKRDLADALKEKLKGLPSETKKKIAEKSMNFTVYFYYGKLADKPDGMYMRILDVACKESSSGFDFKFDDFRGYSPKRQELIEAGRKKIRKAIDNCSDSTMSAEIKIAIKALTPTFFHETTKISSFNTDEEHRWGALEHYYHNKQAGPAYEKILKFRYFLNDSIITLISMVHLMDRFSKKAAELKAPICFPKILDQSENMIRFKNLFPMHLSLTKKGKVVPINGLPCINGNMIGLTGRHGGGKTVTEHALTGNIYLAQSGLPVFADQFDLNIKTHLGMVFIEGIQGKSVVQVLVEKIEKIFAGIDGVPGKNIVLVLDELGSATQESAGMKLALSVLDEMKAKGVSLLFSTQILGVAEAAEQKFGAKCFKINANHKLSPGIAGGDLDSVIEEAGLGKWLKKR